MSPSTSRLPVAFLPHGGGPWPFVEFGLPKQELLSLGAYLREVPHLTATTPRALVVISAHWEEPVPTVISSEKPPLLYDYYGFPPEAYRVAWPAPGDPVVAARVRELLEAAGIPSAESTQRGFDHGTFVPLAVAYPEAVIPVVQLSLKRGLDPSEHLRLGRALAPLRDEGVFILGSGQTFHNMRAFGDPRGREPSEQFDAWLRAAVTASAASRDERLAGWAGAPSARFCHPREEHLMPLLVVAGAAGDDQGLTTWSGTFAGMKMSGFHFG
jgi:aromatic ring-opening dioxygenase catalytic subunit (LigB family)